VTVARRFTEIGRTYDEDGLVLVGYVTQFGIGIVVWTGGIMRAAGKRRR